MKIFIDGSGWNGRESRYMVAFENGKTLEGFFKERKTNNEMEYRSLVEALKRAKKGDIIYSDSQVVVNQVNDIWSCKAVHLFKMYMESKKLLKEKGVTLEWVSRDKNLAGKLLEK